MVRAALLLAVCLGRRRPLRRCGPAADGAAAPDEGIPVESALVRPAAAAVIARTNRTG